MVELGMAKREKLQELYDIDEDSRRESVEFLERWFAFEEYWQYLVNNKLKAEVHNEKRENYYMLEHCQNFKRILGEMSSGERRTALMMVQP